MKGGTPLLASPFLPSCTKVLFLLRKLFQIIVLDLRVGREKGTLFLFERSCSFLLWVEAIFTTPPPTLPKLGAYLESLISELSKILYLSTLGWRGLRQRGQVWGWLHPAP